MNDFQYIVHPLLLYLDKHHTLKRFLPTHREILIIKIDTQGTEDVILEQLVHDMNIMPLNIIVSLYVRADNILKYEESIINYMKHYDIYSLGDVKQEKRKLVENAAINNAQELYDYLNEIVTHGLQYIIHMIRKY